MNKLLFEEKVFSNKEAFLNKVRGISLSLSIDPNWLMAVMNSESSLNPSAVNKTTLATGLIQFMPFTARALGTDTASILTMSNVDQLDLVYKYLLPYKGRMKAYKDVYAAVFFPLAIGKPDDFVLHTDTLSASKIASQNSIFDLNKDGSITVSELREAFLKRVPDSLRDFFDDSKKKS